MLIHAFLRILDMTLAGSFVILCVLAARLLLRPAPRRWAYLLWALVLVRLLCPLELTATISLLPRRTPAAVAYTLEQEDITFWDAADAAQRAVGDVLNGGIDIQRVRLAEERPDAVTGEATRHATARWWEIWVLFGQYVWLAGASALALRGVWSHRRLRKQLATAVRLRDNIYIAEGASTAFVLGLWRPRIYLPAGLTEAEQACMLAHEQHHIRRWDHGTRLLGFAALCLHWFNPLVWLAWRLSQRDMEMSCDEEVLRNADSTARADYAAALLQCAARPKPGAALTPLAFGEAEPVARIRNLAVWKKPALWVSILAGLLCGLLALGLLTSPARPVDAVTLTDFDGGAHDFGVDFALQLGQECNGVSVGLELWENGECESYIPLPVSAQTRSLEMTVDLQPAWETGDELHSITVLLSGDGKLLQQWQLWLQPEQEWPGWSFASFVPQETLQPKPGESWVLASLTQDTGSGARIYDWRTLSTEPQRLEQAEWLLVLRADFTDRFAG